MASIKTRTVGGPQKDKDGQPVKDKPIENRYDVIWRDATGKQKTKTFTRKAQAVQFKATTEADLARGTYIDPDAGKILLADYIAGWLEDRRGVVGETTWAANELRMRVHVVPVLGHLHLSRVNATELRRWLKSISPLAASYQRVILADMKAVLATAVEDELILTNPLKKNARTLRTAKVEPSKPTPWSQEWLHGVIDDIAERYRVAPVIGAGLGMRQGEAFGLALEDIDWLRNTVHIRRQVKILNPGSRLVFGLPKGEKTRTVPLPESVKVELNAHLAKYGATPVTLPFVEKGKPRRMETAALFLVTREGKPLNRNYFNGDIWKPSLQRNAIPTERADRNGYHVLRHTYSSVLLDAGESIVTLSAYLGHAKTSTTLDMYTHLMPGAEGRTKKAIDVAFRSVLETPDSAACEKSVTSEPSGTDA